MKKRKYLLILTLILINSFLIVNIFYTKKTNANNENCYNKNKIFANHDIEISEGVRCNDINNSSYGIGRMLFSFYGTDADCYSSDKTEIQKQKCLDNHIWGGKGTMHINGNWVVRDASRIFFNGHDGAGNHWWMTTTTEPLGNALGLAKHYPEKTTSIIFGNDLVIGDNLVLNEKEDAEYYSHSLHFPRNEEYNDNNGIKIEQSKGRMHYYWLSNKDSWQEVDFDISGDYNNLANDTNLKIMAETEEPYKQWNGAKGKYEIKSDEILYKLPNGINIDGTAKIHATTTLKEAEQAERFALTKYKDILRPSEIEYKKQYAWDYHLYDTDGKASTQSMEQFIGYNPIKYDQFPPYTGILYPQPYVHFRVVRYKVAGFDRGVICSSACNGNPDIKDSLKLRGDIEDTRRDCNNNNVACIESCITPEDIGYRNLGEGGCSEGEPLNLDEIFKCSLFCHLINMDEMKKIP